jgi:phospholipid/cholesterol/gamma-HCH transport system ATP-binding protein
MDKSFAIRVESLLYEVDGHTILRDLNLNVEQGEILAIMGVSGGGKTTLLKCIAGLARPTSGKVWIGNLNLATLSEREKMPVRFKLGIVFQYAALFDYLTVEQNVAFGLERQHQLPASKIREVVRERLDWVGLDGVGRLYPSQLSGGMRKRVGLARALATNPEIVLFDEPTSGLDPVTAYQIDSLISRLNRELNLTAVVVSHDVNSVMRVADRVAMLADGQIVVVDTPDAVVADPHPQVQAFLQAASAKSIR